MPDSTPFTLHTEIARNSRVIPNDALRDIEQGHRYRIETYMQHHLHSMVIECERLVHQHRHTDITLTGDPIHLTVSVTTPANWWQHFKESCRRSKWRRWWFGLSRTPVQYKQVTNSTTATPKWVPTTSFPDMPYVVPTQWGAPIRGYFFEGWDKDGFNRETKVVF